MEMYIYEYYTISSIQMQKWGSEQLEGYAPVEPESKWQKLNWFVNSLTITTELYVNIYLIRTSHFPTTPNK